MIQSQNLYHCLQGRWAWTREEELTCQPVGPRQDPRTGLSGEMVGCGFGVEQHGRINSVIRFSDQNHTSVFAWLVCPSPGLGAIPLCIAALPLDILAQSVPQKGVGHIPIGFQSSSPHRTAYLRGSLPSRHKGPAHTAPTLMLSPYIWTWNSETRFSYLAMHQNQHSQKTSQAPPLKD